MKAALKILSHAENKQHNNNKPLLVEDDGGSHHRSPSSSFHPQDVWAPRGSPPIDFCFIVFIFHRNAIPDWNRCPARLLDWKAPVPRRLRLIPIPTEPRGCGSDNRGGSCSFWHPTSHAKGRALLAVGRPHHSLMTRPLWCPLDGMSVTHGGKSISRVRRELGRVGWQDFRHSSVGGWGGGHTGGRLQSLITFHILTVCHNRISTIIPHANNWIVVVFYVNLSCCSED